ncbi:MAG: TOMM precursor leader peptide-binding protein [Planctomycetaceae bacterium]
MTATRIAHPRLALPFTVIADGELLHLIAGEDVRYSVRAGSLATGLAVLLQRCEGRDSLDALLLELPEAERSAARSLIERLYGERILIDGSVEQLAAANEYRLAVEGRGELADRLSEHRSNTAPEHKPALSLLCQDTLDPNAVREFNRRCLRAGTGPWLWATTGPASRGFVSPVFLPNAGPCLECLLRHFQRLSPVPQLYEALARHGQQDGAFAAVTFPVEGLTILEQIVRWKLAQLSGTPHPALFQLHVLELDSMEVSAHRVFLDPTCPECSDARLV